VVDFMAAFSGLPGVVVWVWSDRAAAWHLSLALDSKFPIENAGESGTIVPYHSTWSCPWSCSGWMPWMDGWMDGWMRDHCLRAGEDLVGQDGAWWSEGISLRIITVL
jgi:hypothetical protein